MKKLLKKFVGGKIRDRVNFSDIGPKTSFVLNGVRHFVIDPPDGHFHVQYMNVGDPPVPIAVVYDPHDMLVITENEMLSVDEKETVFVMGGSESVVVGVDVGTTDADNGELSSAIVTLGSRPPSSFAH